MQHAAKRLALLPFDRGRRLQWAVGCTWIRAQHNHSRFYAISVCAGEGLHKLNSSGDRIGTSSKHTCPISCIGAPWWIRRCIGSDMKSIRAASALAKPLFYTEYITQHHPLLPSTTAKNLRLSLGLRGLFGNSSSSNDPYKVLGVPRTATDKEIKFAYFELAKRYHPDKNPDDPDAKMKFQEAANAYDILSDKSRRANWDTFGSSTNDNSGYRSNSHDPDFAEQMFEKILKDFDIAQTVVEDYFTDLLADISHVSDEVKYSSNYGELWEFIKRRKGLFASVFLPLLVLFRMPAVAVAGTAFVARSGQMLFRFFMALPQSTRQSLITVIYETIRQLMSRTRTSEDDGNKDSAANGNSQEKQNSSSSPPPPGQPGKGTAGSRGKNLGRARRARPK